MEMARGTGKRKLPAQMWHALFCNFLSDMKGVITQGWLTVVNEVSHDSIDFLSNKRTDSSVCDCSVIITYASFIFELMYPYAYGTFQIGGVVQ
ncbi:hypothetical protein E5288_WYG017742 [Bos mutus]|uniref:Uncharacterized protein n=1 Tax=Bos mutus TaxID=72004 RepID=A0A6B0RE81_9CETA|nr:hypothetical protein [Bos mutus]